MPSPSFSFDGLDWKKVKTGAAIAFGGALVAFLPQILTDAHFTVSFAGHTYDYTVLVAAIVSSVINAIKRYIQNHQ